MSDNRFVFATRIHERIGEDRHSLEDLLVVDCPRQSNYVRRSSTRLEVGYSKRIAKDVAKQGGLLSDLFDLPRRPVIWKLGRAHRGLACIGAKEDHVRPCRSTFAGRQSAGFRPILGSSRDVQSRLVASRQPIGTPSPKRRNEQPPSTIADGALTRQRSDH